METTAPETTVASCPFCTAPMDGGPGGRVNGVDVCAGCFARISAEVAAETLRAVRAPA